jgi:transcription elongation factor Elf1
LSNILFTNNEVIILKELLKHCKHSYTRNFRCKNCGHIYEEEFRLHDAKTKNGFGDFVCKNCGENKRWEDIKIRTILFDIKKVKRLELIEEI